MNMRTIKFRGYNAKNKEWLYGSLLKCSDSYLINPEDSDRIAVDDLIVDPESVGQFTGLHDKNGKEIYEGDIVNLVNYGERGDALVLWNQNLGAWCLQLRYEPRVGSKTLGSWLEEEVLEVIGNIHANPELMKGGEK